MRNIDNIYTKLLMGEVKPNYIESDGTQYIDLDWIQHNVENEYEVDYYKTRIGSIFGHAGTQGTLQCCYIARGVLRFSAGYANNLPLTGRHHVVINKDGYSIDGGSLRTWIAGKQSTVDTSIALRLFFASDEESSTQTRIYNFKVRHSGELISNLTPAFVNGKAGLYDTIRQTFHLDPNGRDFLYG